MHNLANKKKRTATVLRKSTDKTVLVRVERRVKDEMFQKYLKKYKNFMVHDEKNECGLGDKVEITECRPLSKTKSWRVSKILEKAAIEE